MTTDHTRPRNAATGSLNSPAGAGGWLRYLPALTLAAVLTITASAEFRLAHQMLGLPPHIAWALPLAIDSYVYAALRSGRDIAAALTVMSGSLAAYTGAHLAAVHTGGPLPAAVAAPAATVIMTVLVIVAWRVHVLIDRLSPVPVPDDADTPPAPAGTPETPARSGTGTGTPSRASTGTGARSRSSTPDTPGSPTTTRPAAGDLSPVGAVPADAGLATRDQAIVAAVLADLTSSGGSAADMPSVRALRRAHAIGQKRATRIRQAIVNHHATSAIKLENESISRGIQGSPEHDGETAPKPGPNERPGKRNEYPHTCITDRVGPANPPVKSHSAHSEKHSDGISDGTVV
jgi:hypothetical protein